MTKLEEVARAISEAIPFGVDQVDATKAARAAIEALREPTEEMERAGDETGCFVASDEDVSYRGREAGNVYTAMIDAILKEGD